MIVSRRGLIGMLAAGIGAAIARDLLKIRIEHGFLAMRESLAANMFDATLVYDTESRTRWEGTMREAIKLTSIYGHSALSVSFVSERTT